MNIFKLISIVTGTAITLGAAYHAQRAVHQYLQENADIDNDGGAHLASRTVTVFVVTTALGGLISHVINHTFDEGIINKGHHVITNKTSH